MVQQLPWYPGTPKHLLLQILQSVPIRLKYNKKKTGNKSLLIGGDGGSRTRVLLILTINDYTFSTTLVLNVPKY